MYIKRFIGGNLESNGYIIYQTEGDSCYIIDPGYGAEKFLSFVREHNLQTAAILLTHHHYDHVGAVEQIRKALDCPVMLHAKDAEQYKGHADRLLWGGEQLPFAQEGLEVIHTPGHTAGGLCFLLPKTKAVFTGDTIFNVDLGRTDLSDGSEAQLRDSCRNIIDQWSNELFLYPGHGDGCNMKTVRKINREFLDMIGGVS